ncbi:MAG: DUF928 domain-containing protein [Kamptonema sp. SIO4C4]|nr:DUF928 domain-containing protein [Kamptonema sp. SIO4C4]
MKIYPLKLFSLTSALLVVVGGGTVVAAEATPAKEVQANTQTLMAGGFTPPDRGMPASTQDGGTRGSFHPPDRGMPSSTQDGGTRGAFDPPNRGMPSSTQDGGTRGSFDPPDRGMPSSTQDGGTRSEFDPPDRGMPSSTQDSGSRGEFEPPDRGMPSSTQDTGTRTVYATQILQTLVPPNALPLTVEAYPTFFWHMPEIEDAAQLEFVLMAVHEAEEATEKTETLVYSTHLAMPETAGIMYLQLPQEEQYALQEGQRYHWYVSVVYNPNDRTRDNYVEGWVERLASDDPLAQQVAGLDPAQHTQAFADAGIWHEALTHWAQKRDVAIADWQEFLQSVNLQQYAQSPLINAAELELVAQDISQ